VKGRLIAGVVAAGALAAAVSGAQGANVSKVPTGAKVTVTDFEYTEAEVTIQKGEKVVWAFKEGKHNVTSGKFKSKNLKSGKFKHTFEDVGTFKYRCTLHQPDMDGVVKVVR
jgi:plastocyanin